MPLSQGDIDAVLERAREFYKHGWKTANKFYPAPVLPKHFRRALSTGPLAQETLRMQRRYLLTESRAEYGRQLLENNLTLGNCSEVAAVIGWLCKTSAQVSAQLKWNLVAYTIGSANHYFNVVCDASAAWPATLFSTIAQAAASESAAGIWVIDHFMKTSCPISEYLERIRDKAAEWTRQGKHIGYAYAACTSSEFVNFIATQPLYYELL